MSVEIDIEYQGDLCCEAVHEPSGEILATEAPVDNGGQGRSFSPTDLTATAMGTCLMTIMGIVAKREGLDLRGMRARVIKEMASQPVRRIGALTISLTMPSPRKKRSPSS